MNQIQTEKLKSLISTSAVLSPQERAEWLALLDVMDDKQAGELEKILTGGSGGQQSSSSAPPPNLSRPSTPPSRQDSRAPLGALAPSFGESKKEESKGRFTDVPRQAGPSVTSDKTPVGFVTPGQLLKNMQLRESQDTNPSSLILNRSQKATSGTQLEADRASSPLIRPDKSRDTFSQREKVIGNSLLGEGGKVVSTWRDRLKNIISRKELPPAHPEPEFELELTDGTQNPSDFAKATSDKSSLILNPLPQAKISPSASKEQAFGTILKPTLESSTNLTASRPQQPGIALGVPLKQAPEVPKPPSAPLAPKQKIATALPTSVPELPSVGSGIHTWPKLGPTTQAPTKPPPLAQTQFGQGETAAGTKIASTSNIQPGVEFVKPAPAKPPSRKVGFIKEVALKQVTDLENLSAAKLKSYDLQDFLTSIRKLMNKYGYHNVLFHLEKSPLYKSYLETGTKILNEGTDFDSLLGTGGQGYLGAQKYLSREDFEDFTDLLMEIQAG